MTEPAFPGTAAKPLLVCLRPMRPHPSETNQTLCGAILSLVRSTTKVNDATCPNCLKEF